MTCTIEIDIRMARWKPPEIEDVSEPFCGCRRKHMVPLLDAYPIVSSEWCYEKNAGWGPEDFSHASTVNAWWVCPYCLREYKARVSSRTANLTGCPYCASKKVCEDNALSVFHPVVSKEWHPKKNGKLKVSDVTRASEKVVWWLCSSCGHEWQARVSDRTLRESGCPACYESRMEYAREHPPPRKRGHVVLSNSNATVSRAWYDAGRIDFTPLSESHPRIAKQWHTTKNGAWTPSDFAYGSEALVWWKCKKGIDHEWQSPIYSRTAEGRHHCPFCIGKRVSVTNSLQTLYPKIANQWHPTLNGKLTPADVTARSGKKLWWLCPKSPEHFWETTVCLRTRGSNCPFCSHQKPSKDTNLKAIFPYIAAQWHPSKNGSLRASDVMPTSGRKVWWTCEKGPDHEWQATVANRTGRGSGCPFCAGRKVSVTNCLKTTAPQIAKQWHPTKNGALTPRDVGGKSYKEVWWQCPKNKKHVWKDSIYDRTTRKRDCKQCPK